MPDSFALSLFIFAVPLVQFLFYDKLNLAFLKKGSDISLPKWVTSIILVMAALLGIGLSTIFVYFNNPQSLQLFYIALFTLSWMFLLFFYLPLPIKWRMIVSLGLGLLMIVIVQRLRLPILENIFMAGSLLWIGPLIFKLSELRISRNKISLKWVVVLLLVVLVVDFYNVLVAETPVAFSDEGFFLNGILTFNNASIGFADVLLILFIVVATIRYFGRWPALILSALITLPRVTIRLIFPELLGVTIPYFTIIVPITIFYWALIYYSKIYISPNKTP